MQRAFFAFRRLPLVGWAALLAALLWLGPLAATAQTWDWLTVGRTPFPSQAGGVATDRAGNVFVAGSFNYRLSWPGLLSIGTGFNSAYIVKLTPTGQPLWQQTVTGGTSGTGPLAVDSAGNVIAIITFYDSVYFGNQLVRNPADGDNFIVAKLDGQTGAWLWATPAGGPRRAKVQDVALNPAGDVFVVGGYVDSARFGGQLLVNVQTPVNTYFSLFVAGINGRTGAWSFARGASGVRHGVTAGGICVDAASNVYIGGKYFSRQPIVLDSAFSLPLTPIGSSTSSFVAKLSPLQGWQWVAAVPVTPMVNRVELNELAWGSSGRLATAGVFAGSATFGVTTLQVSPPNNRLFVAEIDQNGTWQWAVDNGGPVGGNNLPITIRPLPNGGLALAGENVEQFGPHTAPAPFGSSTNVYAAALNANHQWVWAAGSGGSGSGGGFRMFAGMDIDPSGRLTLVGATSGRSGTAPVFSFGSLAVPDTGVYVVRLSPPPVGRAEEEAPDAPLRVWPNPATGTAWVRGGSGAVTLTDALGRVVLTQAPAADPAADLRLDVRALPPGMYTVRRGAVARRLVVSLNE